MTKTRSKSIVRGGIHIKRQQSNKHPKTNTNRMATTETSCASTCSDSASADAAASASALMDATVSPVSSKVQELKDIRNLLWGTSIRTDVFRRWSQGLCATLTICSNAVSRAQALTIPFLCRLRI